MNDKKRNIRNLLILLGVLILGLLIGRWTSSGSSSGGADTSAVSAETVWTCSMHPQIRQNEPGLCPLCGMDLIPADDDVGDSGLPADALRMSPTAMQLASVHTQVVQRGGVTKDIRLSGKVTLDPKVAFTQNAHVPGRIETFYVNTIGEYVEKGQKIAVLSSPELLSAQQELLSAYQNRDLQPGVFEAVKSKLRLWKIEDAQIQEILQGGKPIEPFPVYANQSGYLIKKNVEAGDYVERGSALFDISRLNSLWGVFDVYEKDAGFIRKGMKIEYTLPSMPGKKFESVVDFVSPILNPDTRTLSARILISNPNLDFKPEMLINGMVSSGMSAGEDQIIIPKSAVMWTGKHSVVYVKHSSDDHIGFQMRPVVLGPSLGDAYVVEEGLQEGEEIVVEGTFSVDAAAQLANKPSMMNYTPPSPGLTLVAGELSGAQKQLLQPLFAQYFKLKDALVGDDLDTAKKDFEKLSADWHKTDWKQMPEEISKVFMEAGQESFLDRTKISKTGRIDPLRNELFYDLSNFFIRIAQYYGPFGQTIYVQHCPMANKDKGADWLSLEKEVLNPYYGASMLKCGEVKEEVK